MMRSKRKMRCCYSAFWEKQKRGHGPSVANSRVAPRMLRSEVLKHKFTDIRKKLRDDPSASKGDKTDVIGAMRISLLIAPGKGSGPAVASLRVEAQSRFRGKISISRQKTRLICLSRRVFWREICGKRLDEASDQSLKALGIKASSERPRSIPEGTWDQGFIGAPSINP
jgi:hypothetical protein